MVKRKKDPMSDEEVVEEVIVEEFVEEIVVEEVPEEETPAEVSVSDLADQVLRGEWGVGQDRRLRLSMAGHNPNLVQQELVRRANKR